MLPAVGEICLHLAFVVAFATMVLGAIAGTTGSRRYTTAACHGVFVAFGLVAVSCSTLLHALATHNFDLVAVSNYSDTRMPAMYLMAAFWGGQSGSLTFWSGMLSLFSALAVALHKDSDRPLMPWFSAVTMSLLSFLIFILLFKSNPFETFLVMDAPPEGKGLNPLLQTPLMVMHPPSLLTGYVSMAIPFAFAMAALISNRLDNAWLAPARRWTLVSWLFLSIGNMLGGMWAYEELGWGGYWAWDPVENAAFMPWLTATAFLHSIMIQERRGMLRRWNMVLVTISFLLTLLGTFITRSGLIESVHTFAQSSIGDYFFALLMTYVTLAVVMVAVRWKPLASRARLDSPLSREAVFVSNNWILMGMTFVVFWGTLFPKFKEWVTGDKVSVGPPWFNKFMIPLGLVLVLLMGIGTLISWKKATAKNFRRNFLWPIVATLIAAPAVCALYATLRLGTLDLNLVPKEAGFAIAGVSLAIFVISASTSEYVRGVRARMRGSRGKEGLLEATYMLLVRQRRRYGGYIVHLGFVLAVIGFSGNAFKVEQDVSMRRGEVVELGDYLVRFDKLEAKEDGEKVLYFATLTVSRDGEELATVTPGRAHFHASPNMPTSEIDIRTGVVEDLYFALTGFDDRGETASFKMIVEPLVWWFWFGGSILILGCIICLWPQEQRMPTTVFRRSAAAANAAKLLVAVSVSMSPFMLYHASVQAQPNPAQEREVHDHSGDADGPTVRVLNPRLRRLMDLIRVNCPGQGDPILSQSKPTCPDYKKDRETIETMLRDGKSDDDIIAHFVGLRGERVLAIPPDAGGNWLSWALPLGLMVVAVPLLALRIRAWSRNGDDDDDDLNGSDDEGRGDDSDDPWRDRLDEELAQLS